MTKEEEKYTALDTEQCKWWVNTLFTIAKEKACNSHNFDDGEEMQAAQDKIIKSLEIVEEFEKAQIITGGRLNGRTYAYKCGLEDGKRKALEQPTMDKAMIHTLAKENDELKAEIGRLRQALEQQSSEDCISRASVKELFQEGCVMGMYDFLGIDDLPPVTPTFPKGATNGDMIKAMFPNGKYGTNGNEVHVYGVGGNGCLVFTLEWWNAPYEEN